MKSAFAFLCTPAIALGAILVAAPAGIAADAPRSRSVDDSMLPPSEILRKAEAAGYTNLHDLEFDDGRWELEATSPKGVAVDLTVDPRTGEILHEEAD